MKRVEVAERLLAQVWKRQLLEARKLVTGSGERVCVIYPGRENRDRGPDFVGAVISTADGVTLRGDVELHSRASDWRIHGHHRDSNYNNVILQVVWEGDEVAVLESGRVAPTVSLCHCLDGSLDDIHDQAGLPLVPSEPCCNARERLGDRVVGRLLDEAGEERFRIKAGDFAAALCVEQPSQVLYRGVMGALGYTKNKEAFEELSCRLPLEVLEGLCCIKSYLERVTVLEALLLGKAGLLPDDGGDERERIWHSLGGGETMSPDRWRVFRIRPGNHPARRLAGAAHLLARFMETGLFEGVLQLVSASSLSIGKLESSFMVRDYGPCSNGKRKLIGQGRAREIVVNIVLPFIFAWAEACSHRRLERRILALYRRYPVVGEYGMTRELKGLLGVGASELVGSARRQQGLLHLDKMYCRPRECIACPVARRLSSAALAG